MPTTAKSLWQSQRLTYWEAFRALLGAIVILFIIEAADRLFFNNNLFRFGLQRGDFEHWYHMFFAPFIHDGWSHLIGNAIGLLLLGSIVLLLGFRTLLIVTLFSIIATGAGILMFGTPGLHAGASCIVYGYFAFLVVRGLYEKSWHAIVLGIVILLVFQGLLNGLLPSAGKQISWVGHAFGALGGIAAAGTLAKERKSA
ncbi:MAG: rhomboid family intramembrane serine protease [Verrucomicrobiota bacterium]